MKKRTANEIKRITALIDSSKGQWMNVTCYKRGKRNGEGAGDLRNMTCKNADPTGLQYDPADHNLRCVLVANEGRAGAENYRMLNLETVVEIKAKGKVIKFAA